MNDIDFDELNKIGEDWERQVVASNTEEPQAPEDTSAPQNANVAQDANGAQDVNAFQDVDSAQEATEEA